MVMAGVLALWLVGCARPGAEEQVRAQVAALQHAVEHRDLGDAMDLVADDFAGNNGLDRDGLRALMRLQFLVNANVRATLGPLQVTLQGQDHATVKFSALLTGGSGRLLPDQAGTYQVTTGWRRDGGDWKLYTAQWQR